MSNDWDTRHHDAQNEDNLPDNAHEDYSECTIEHPVQLDDGLRYTHTDENYEDHYRQTTPRYCSEWRYPSTSVYYNPSSPPNGPTYCDYHLQLKVARYPQGWSYYPGDICPHGMYTGGSGIDWMCGHCEAGLTQWVPQISYALHCKFAGGAPTEVPTVNRWTDAASSIEAKWNQLAGYFRSLAMFQPYPDTDHPNPELSDPTDIINKMEWYALQVSSGYWADPSDPTSRTAEQIERAHT